MNVLAAGSGVFKPPGPDAFRRHTRDYKERRLVSKVMSEHEAIERFAHGGKARPVPQEASEEES